MKNKKISKFLAVVTTIAVISISSFVFADVGNINRYNSGSKSSSSTTTTTRNKTRIKSNSSSSGSISIGGIVIIVIVGVGVIYIIGKSKGKINNIKDMTDLNKVKGVFDDLQNMTDSLTDIVKTDTKGVAERIRQLDPEFSEDKFLSWSKDVFMKIQSAWSARDWKIIRPFESNELFEQHSAQLQEYINNNKINIIERVAIDSAELINYKVDGDKDVLEVYLKAVMRDYIVDADTRKVLEGNPNTDWHMKYKLIFTRKTGIKTQAGKSNVSTTNCPNCGAPTQITSAGECEYCGSVITTGEHDWVLSGLEGVK